MEYSNTRHNLTHSEMDEAVGMLRSERSQADVARHFNVSRSVICRLWQRQCMTGSPYVQRPGRERVTTSAQDRFIQLQVRREPTLTARQLQSRLWTNENIYVSDQTIRNRLHENNLHARRPLRCPPIRHGNRVLRNDWCQNHRNWTEEEWSKVLFTDESRFGFHPDTRRTRIWRQPGNAERLKVVQEVHRYSGGTVMVWAGIMTGKRTDLVFPEGNLSAASYINEILEPVVLPFSSQIGSEFIFMHDNARPHTARITTDWFEAQEIHMLPWPAQSPDLNPIEHAWDQLQRSILPHLASITTRVQLCSLLQDHWRQIPQDSLDTLISSMPRRCQSVLNARGGNTIY